MKTVIIGAGQAAASLVARLRAKDESAEIVIIGDEPLPPYQRPPLSKAYLSGEMDLERLYLRPLAWYQDNQIELRLGARVGAIDRTLKTLSLVGGEVIGYDNLVLATGSRPRELPASVTKGARNIYTVRSVADVDAMKHEFAPGRNLVVVGAGYIGLEAAAVARKFGVNVTVVEAASRILGRVACTVVADFIYQLHDRHGVEIVTGGQMEGIEVTNGVVTGVKMSDDREIPADFMIVGIGIHANDELAAATGLKTDNGIVVDDHCRTDDAAIYAAGDCARFLYDGDWVRLESVGNAIDMGEVIADNLAGVDTVYRPKPWFWSDQYDLTVQIAGLHHKYNHSEVRPGRDENSQSVWYYIDDRLIAVAALSDARAYLVGKRLVEAGKSIPREAAANPEVELKAFLKA